MFNVRLFFIFWRHLWASGYVHPRMGRLAQTTTEYGTGNQRAIVARTFWKNGSRYGGSLFLSQINKIKKGKEKNLNPEIHILERRTN